MSQPQTEFDSPWKDVIERYFEDFIHFFLPQAHGEIEWSRGFEFLDIELQQVVRDAELPSWVMSEKAGDRISLGMNSGEVKCYSGFRS